MSTFILSKSWPCHRFFVFFKAEEQLDSGHVHEAEIKRAPYGRRQELLIDSFAPHIHIPHCSIYNFPTGKLSMVRS